jgi:hypothetical protein
MPLADIDIDLLALVDELTTHKGRLFGQVLQVVQTSRGGWGIILARNAGRLYFQARDCAGGLPQKGSLVSFQPCPTSKNRPARDIKVLAVPEKPKQ